MQSGSHAREHAPLNAQSARQSWSGKKLTQEELGAVATAHARFVRRERDGAKALLSNAILSGLTLRLRLWKDADFSHADLSSANISNADLTGANLFGANLSNAKLREAVLARADLRGVNLRGADLTFAILDGADFGNARMVRHSKDDAPEHGGVDFSNCSLKGASFSDANIKGANFKNAILSGVTFKNARMTDVCLEGAILTQVDRNELPFTAAELSTCLLDPTADAISRISEVMRKLRLHETWFETGGKDGEAAILDDADLRPVKGALHGRRLTALHARGSICVGVDFSNSQLQGAHFDDADLRDANFDKADLRGASFRNAKLAHATFAGANLSPLQLQSGAFQQTDLSGAQYSEAQFRNSAR